jgi:hypothetical protein
VDMVSYADDEVGSLPPARSGTQRFLSRSVQVFFGRPILFLLPAVAITLFGIYSGQAKSSEFRSSGAISVSEETFLGSLSDTRTGDFGFDTAATTITRQFNELMQTDGFALSVTENAGLGAQVESGQISLDKVRLSVYAAAAGDSLMRINAVSESPLAAQALADSAIKTYKNWVTDAEIGQFEAAERFYEELLNEYKKDVDAANDAYTDYVIENPAPADPRDQRDTAEQLEIAQLDAQLTRAQDRFDAAVDNREKSRQATQTSAADIDQRLQVVDAPRVPALPEAGLKDLLITVVMFGVLGTLVSLCAVALVSALDRSILSIADLEHLGPPVVAVVPWTRDLKVPRRRPDALEAPRKAKARSMVST